MPRMYPATVMALRQASTGKLFPQIDEFSRCREP
jgi:hypothetical protein